MSVIRKAKSSKCFCMYSSPVINYSRNNAWSDFSVFKSCDFKVFFNICNVLQDSACGATDGQLRYTFDRSNSFSRIYHKFKSLAAMYCYSIDRSWNFQCKEPIFFRDLLLSGMTRKKQRVRSSVSLFGTRGLAPGHVTTERCNQSIFLKLEDGSRYDNF